MDRKHQLYDLSPIVVEELLSHAGFGVQLRHYNHLFEQSRGYPEWLKDSFWSEEEVCIIKAEMREAGCLDDSAYAIVRFDTMKYAERAELARSRIHLGIQVAGRMASQAENIVGIRVIGAESQLAYRSPERGIRDLDLMVDLEEELTPLELAGISAIKRAAEEETGIPVDLICPGLPITADNMEHLTFRFEGPVGIRGFPVFWRSQEYLDWLLAAKNTYFDRSAEHALELMKGRRIERI